MGVVDGGAEDLLVGGLVEKIVVAAFLLWLRSIAVSQWLGWGGGAFGDGAAGARWTMRWLMARRGWIGT